MDPSHSLKMRKKYTNSDIFVCLSLYIFRAIYVYFYKRKYVVKVNIDGSAKLSQFVYFSLILRRQKQNIPQPVGMSRLLKKHTEYYAVYHMKPEQSLAVRWAAPETFLRRIFSKKSDVWAFAVVLWEIYTETKVTTF